MKNTISVVGLGPGALKHMTLETYHLIQNSTKVFLRTMKHPAAVELVQEGILVESFDSIYDTGASFDEVYETIAKELIKEAKIWGSIVYAVPGHPYFAEKSVEILLKILDNEQGTVDVKSFPAMSFLDSMVHTLKVDPIHGLCMVDGLTLQHATLPLDQGIVVTQVYDRFVASEVKLRLMELYRRDDKEIFLVHGSGLPEERVERIPLYDLDRSPHISYLTSVYLPPEPKERWVHLEGLVEIMERLRSDDGCPWDREQTYASLRKYVIEEAYEVVDAIERQDWDDLCEELGDLLLQVVFLSQLAQEDHWFDVTDVLERIQQKLIYRHPHVFAQEDKNGFTMEVWEKLKREEKGYERISHQMDAIPKHFPAYMRAEKAQKKASLVGFDWKDPKDALEKVKEEWLELEEALIQNRREDVEEEAGDLIFSIINVVRLLKLDFREVLEKTTEKFIHRFTRVEDLVLETGHSMEELDLNALDELWNKAKEENR